MTTCLIVIDAQESFRHRSYFIQRDLPGYLNAQNRLIQGFIERDLPIVQVLHADGPARADNPFAHVSGHVVPLSELQAYEPAARFVIQPDGRPLGAADIKARTATVLAGRFATLCSVDEAIARAEATSVIASA